MVTIANLVKSSEAAPEEIELRILFKRTSIFTFFTVFQHERKFEFL